MIDLVFLIVLSATAAARSQTLRLRELPERVADDHIELRGVAAGAFDPQIWEKGTLHWVPDIRRPMLAPREGKFRNIYAPSIVKLPVGWRIFFGGWDGVPTGNDRIYSIDTPDFITSTDRKTVIEHGAFQHVCNVNAARDAKGGFEMLCTALLANNLNKPVYFASPDGAHWNRSAAVPHVATAADLVTMSGYAGFAGADINGMNVLLREGNQRRMYFGNFREPAKTFRASSNDGRSYTFERVVLNGPGLVNDVKKLLVRAGEGAGGGNDAWYLMALHGNTDRLWYTLSRDGLAFPAARMLFAHQGDDDQFMVALGFVVDGAQDTPGRRVLGVLYGAGAKPSLDANRIFAQWLQKRLVVNGKDVKAALGPDCAVIATHGRVSGKIEMFEEDGKTLLGNDLNATLEAGRAYEVSVSK
jgi:hypothetical protein